MNSWYAAHIIMFVEFKEDTQTKFPVWENIVLIQADSEDLAFEKAERCGMDNAGDEQGSFRWGNKPARWVFAGIRKLTECASYTERPSDGTEITYTQFEVDSRADLDRLTAGDPVQICYNEPYRPVTSDFNRKTKRRRKQA